MYVREGRGAERVLGDPHLALEKRDIELGRDVFYLIKVDDVCAIGVDAEPPGREFSAAWVGCGGLISALDVWGRRTGHACFQ